MTTQVDPFGLDTLAGEYDQAEPVEQTGGRLPEGTYQARVERVEMKHSKNGSPMLSWELKVESGSYTGRKLFRNNMLMAGEPLRYLKTDLAIAGLQLEDLRQLPQKLEDLLDVWLQVYIQHDKNDEKFYSVYFNQRITPLVPQSRSTQTQNPAPRSVPRETPSPSLQSNYGPSPATQSAPAQYRNDEIPF